MSHDVYSSFAAAELAVQFSGQLATIIGVVPTGVPNVFAGREPGRTWPLADGVISIESPVDNIARTIAVEFKRENEGIHGLLTGIGQVQAYLAKGHSGSVLVVPSQYGTHDAPGDFAAAVLGRSAPTSPVSVVTYTTPDLTRTRPFLGCLTVVRPLVLGAQVSSGLSGTTNRVQTQWVHAREGSVFPDALYRYLKAAREASTLEVERSLAVLPSLAAAVGRVDASADARKFLSNTVGDSLAERTWRQFWFRFVLTEDVQRIYTMSGGAYSVNRAATQLVNWNGGAVEFFSKRVDSIKQKIVRKLNSGGGFLPDAAWDEFAENVRGRAHSLREDIDSFLEGAGLVDAEGRLSVLGNRFVDACDRAGTANAQGPLGLLRYAYLVEGDALAFLHYVYRLSDGLFTTSPMRFCTTTGGSVSFQRAPYLDWIENEMRTTLRVLATSSTRGGVARKPFQAELAILRHLGIVAGFRPGLGVEINWPLVHESLAV